jgi:hypothetical protein
MSFSTRSPSMEWKWKEYDMVENQPSKRCPGEVGAMSGSGIDTGASTTGAGLVSRAGFDWPEVQQQRIPIKRTLSVLNQWWG